MVRKNSKVSWTINTNLLEQLEDQKVKFDQFRAKPVSLSKLASAHLKRSLNIPAEIELND